MERGNGNTVLLTVIGVATLLVALVGATFAYFTAGITSNIQAVNVTTAQLAGLTVNAYALQGGTDYYPGWKGYQVVEVAADGTGTGNYTLSLEATNGIGDNLTYQVYEADGVSVATGGVVDGLLAQGSLTSSTLANNAMAYYIDGASFTTTGIGTSLGNAATLASNNNIKTTSFDGSYAKTFVVLYTFVDTETTQADMNKTFTTSWSAHLNSAS